MDDKNMINSSLEPFGVVTDEKGNKYFYGIGQQYTTKEAAQDAIPLPF